MPLRSMLPWLLCSLAAEGQARPPQPSGDYTGKLGTIHLVLHLKQAEAGKLAASLDSPDQGANGIPAEVATLTPAQLTVTFPSLHATYTAAKSPDGKTLTGTWTQGASTPLILHQQEPFVPAAKPSAIDGDWTGALPTGSGSLTLVLHIKSDRRGTEYLTFDSPAQNVSGLIADNVAFTGKQLTFDLPVVHGHYTGQLTPDGSLSGTWTQGASTPLSFTHLVPFIPAAKPSAVDGEWIGTVATPKGNLHLLLHIRSDHVGTEYITLDSPDQLATGYEATHTEVNGRTLSFDLPQLHGTFSGTVTQTGLDGIWTQTTSMPVHLAHPLKPSPQANTMPPQTPLTLSAVQALLDAELKPVAENPTVAGTGNLGVAIGLVSHGQQQVFTYGIAAPTSIFEIGSLTKTFTGLLLAQAVTTGTVTLDTPLRTLLPAKIAPSSGSPEITLLSLATHHSGLPRMPNNFHPANPRNPYADYTLANLDSFIATHGTARSPSASFLYSNVGAALLGQALAAKAGMGYTALLQRDVLEPLHMTHTFLTVPAIDCVAVLRGLTEDDQPASAWDLDAFAPAGGLHATAGDLLLYLEAQLHPPETLRQPLTLQHQLQADAGENRIAISWLFDPPSGDYWHNGGTGGFTSYAFFNPEKDIAGIVLVNRASSLADSLGRQVSALLEGRTPAPLRH